MAADLLLSIASGDKFLGEFAIASQARSLFMSGESGFAILQETARRICEAKGRRLSDIKISGGPNSYRSLATPLISKRLGTSFAILVSNY